jgi:aryl-alcohol dehydrogenase-like predicted oxidoreductase
MNFNKILLGTAQFGSHYGINNKSDIPDFKQVNKILNYAHDNEVTILDTSESYGNSQNKIGEFHKKSKKKFKVITKFSNNNFNSRFNLEKHLQNNLNVLGVNNLYSYMFHSFNDFNQYGAFFFDQLVKCKEKGLIEKIGVSLYDNEEFDLLIRNYKIDLIQVPFNLFDNLNLRNALLDKAKFHNIEIHTRSTFLQGVFFKKLNSIDPFFSSFKENLIKVHQIAKSYNTDILSLALNYAVCQQKIDKVLIGIDNFSQLKKCFNTFEIKQIDEMIDSINKINFENKNLLNPTLWKNI